MFGTKSGNRSYKITCNYMLFGSGTFYNIGMRYFVKNNFNIRIDNASISNLI